MKVGDASRISMFPEGPEGEITASDGESTSCDAVRRLKRLFEIAVLNPSAIDSNLGSDGPDFGDGPVRAATEFVFCDFVVSHDAKAPSPYIAPSGVYGGI